MKSQSHRIERDSLGEVNVPEDALYGAQTQRARENFQISGSCLPRPMIRALAQIKGAAARVNARLGLLDDEIADAVAQAAAEVEEGRHDRHFPVDIFQTGSGTSSNMNANEVIARLASMRLGKPVLPNDHVNLGQSSNDVFPTAIHVSACTEIKSLLLPSLAHLIDTLELRMQELDNQVKTGRTHLMDAMPVRFGQELGGWSAQIRSCRERIVGARKGLGQLALGGTAVGTGINAHPDFAVWVVRELEDETGIPFGPAGNYFAVMGSQDAAVELSGQLRVLALCLLKIANDLRWMNSGPLAGLGEISLPALQPGSSIMPGKVNPVIPEAVAMACTQVVGLDAAVAMAGGSGNFQLNVMLPLIARNLLESIELLGNAARHLADKAIRGFTVNRERIDGTLSRNAILITGLTPLIGYEKGAEIVKKALSENRPLLDVAEELTDLPRDQLEILLDPGRLTEGGIP